MKTPFLTVLILTVLGGANLAQECQDYDEFSRLARSLWSARNRSHLESLVKKYRVHIHRFYVRCEVNLLKQKSGENALEGGLLQALARAIDRAYRIDFYLERTRKILAPEARKSWPDLLLAWQGHPRRGDPVLEALVSMEQARHAIQRVPPSPLPAGMRTRIRMLRNSGCPDGALDGLLSLGIWHQLHGEFLLSDRAFKSAERLNREIQGGRGFEILTERGELALKREDLIAARSHFTTALEYSSGYQGVVARAYLAQTHAYLQELAKAQAEANKVVIHFDTLPKSTRVITALLLAEVNLRLGKVDGALEWNRKAEEILVSEEGKDTRRLLFARRQRGYVFMVMGQFNRAEGVLKAGLKEAERLNDRVEQIYHLRYLSVLAFWQAKEGQTLMWGMRMLEAARKERAAKELTHALRFLGKVCFRWGATEDAALYLKEALEVVSRVGVLRWRREIVRDFLEVLEKQGRNKEAKHYESALRKDLFKGRPASTASDLLLLARLARSRGETEQAVKDLKKAMEILDAMPDSGMDPLVEWLRGATAIEAAEQSESIEDALEYLDEAVQFARNLKDPILEAGAITRKGERLSQAGALEEAREEFERAYGLSKGIREATGHLSIRSSIYEDSRDVMGKLTSITMELERKNRDPGRMGRILRMAEDLRDRRFRSQYSSFGAEAGGEEFRKLLGELEEVHKLWEGKYTIESAGRRVLYDRLIDLRDEFNRLSNEAWQQHSRIDPTTLDPGKLQTRLGSALLLEFVFGKDRGFLIAVGRKEGIRVFPLSCGVKALEGRVQFLDTILQRLRMGNEAYYADISHTLFKDLLGPVLDAGWIPPGRPLIVVPDKVVERLPFHALVTRPHDTKQKNVLFRNLHFLIRRNPVRYLTSAGDLLAPRPEPCKPRFLGVAPGEEVTHLRGTVEEVKTLTALFPQDQAHAALGKDAGEDRFCQRPDLKTFNILHFATHGLASALTYRYSGLVLGTGNERDCDGVLHGYEVKSLGIAPLLVVLSACSSGTDLADPGVTGVGWGRVFLEAEVGSVVLSLWRVEDFIAPRFMEVFYRNLLEGDAADLALAGACRAMISRPGPDFWANPRYWAPFILVGAAVKFEK